MGIELNTINYYGTHKMTDVFINSLKSIKLFILLFIIGFIISKKINKKTFIVNNIIYLILTIVYFITSFLKAYVISNLPPHDLIKDLCGLKYSIVQIIITYHIPIIYTIIIFILRLKKNPILNKKQVGQKLHLNDTSGHTN